MFAKKWCWEHPSEATAYIKPPPPAVYSDNEDPPRQHSKIIQPKAFRLAVTRLLLCVVKEDVLVLGEINDLLQAGFVLEKEIAAHMYSSHQEFMTEGLGEVDRNPFRNLVMPPCPKPCLNAILAGNWSTEDPTSKKQARWHLRRFLPLTRNCVKPLRPIWTPRKSTSMLARLHTTTPRS